MKELARPLIAMSASSVIVVLTCWSAAAGAVQPVVIFNNFGPEDEYHPDWYLSVSLWEDWLGTVDVDAAMAFVPAGGDYYLDTIELAMDIRQGANELDVWLMEDDSGQPGVIVEEIHLSDAVPPYPGVYPPVLAVSEANSFLAEGVRYWIGVSATGPPDIQMGWHPNVTGYEGLGAHRQRIDGVGDWSIWPDLDCTFRVKGVPVTGSVTHNPAPGRALSLYSFPNPFDSQTTISYSLAFKALVDLWIADVSGRHIRTLRAQAVESPGPHRAVWDGRDDRGRMMSSAIYVYRLEAGNQVQTRRLILMR